MSLGITEACWATRSEVSSNQLIVLLALARWTDNEGRCVVTVNYVCNMTRLQRSAVSRHLAALERLGLLTRTRKNQGKCWSFQLKVGAP